MNRPHRRARTDRGFSLIETMMALGLLAVVAVGILPMGLMATQATENQGHLMARTTEYASDKLEQLLALAYGDAVSDTTKVPTADSGGSGLTPGGSFNPASPVASYVDYLDINGHVLESSSDGAPADWFYQRAWLIEATGSGPVLYGCPANSLKRITVTATVKAAALGGAGLRPQSTVSSLKSCPF